MKIVIAPDSFKGSLTAAQAANCMAQGAKRACDCETVLIPMADGGEGTVDAVVSALGGSLVEVLVKNPLHEDIPAVYGIAGETAIIEMSAASGITKLPASDLNPMKTSTYGTGQLMLDALNQGCTKLMIGIGGSATNDGGAGMAAALGVRFTDKEGRDIMPCGGNLDQIETIDLSNLSPLVARADIKVACDVTNPLCGETGASFVFAPQKGADAAMTKVLDANLHHFGELIHKTMGQDVFKLPGGGAAGGLGAGLVTFCGAKLCKGIQLIAETVSLSEKLAGADLVLTGEGCTDFQTAFGKLPCGVGNAAKEQGIPCIIISGSVKGDISSLYEQGITAAFSSVTSVITLEEAMEHAEEYLSRATENAIRAFIKGW